MTDESPQLLADTTDEHTMTCVGVTQQLEPFNYTSPNSTHIYLTKYLPTYPTTNLPNAIAIKQTNS